MLTRLRRLAKTPVSRRTLFEGVAALIAAGFAGKWLVDEYGSSGEGTVAGMKSHAGNWTPTTGTPIAVSEFKKNLTVEELNKSAEHYFASRSDWDPWLVKPLGAVEEAPALLSNFAQVLNGLQLLPGMTVLDFGAGSCWASRWLTQLGMEVIALDVSETALKIGQALYARQPVIGRQPAPRFLPFDGRRIGLPDASVDRILCLDTFHHLLNPHEVLAEMSRVLKPDGLAGFSEPGPRHSTSFQSQFEMRNFKVLEDDIDMRQIWASARQAGFARLRLGVFAPYTLLLSLPDFEDYLEGGKSNQQFANIARARMQDHRLFFLYKTVQVAALDSRSRDGLAAKLEVKALAATVKAGAPLAFQVTVTNSGKATWLPRSAKRGAVFIGVHLLDASGTMQELGYFRHALMPGEGRPIAPGETLSVDVQVPAPPRGSYILEFDLLSEFVAWFSIHGSQAVRLAVQVT